MSTVNQLFSKGVLLYCVQYLLFAILSFYTARVFCRAITVSFCEICAEMYIALQHPGYVSKKCYRPADALEREV